MKKRAMIIAMMAAMLTVTSDCTVKLLHAEETQTKEAQAEDSQSEGTSQLPIKALSPKVVEENPYMAKVIPTFIMTATIPTLQMRCCR